jgi:hypothetical protein
MYPTGDDSGDIRRQPDTPTARPDKNLKDKELRDKEKREKREQDKTRQHKKPEPHAEG